MSARSRCRRLTAWSTSWSPTRREAVAVTKRLLGYFQGATATRTRLTTKPACATMVPERARRAYHVGPDHRDARRRRIGDVPARALRARDGDRAGARSRAAPVGILANNTRRDGGRDHRDAADKAARFLQLCDAFGLPVVSLVDCPGYMVGPAAEAEALVRRASRMLVAGGRAAGAAGRGRPAARLRAWRAGDVRRQPARAAADGGMAGRAPRPDGPRGCGAARAAQGARGDRRRRRTRAARPGGYRRRRRQNAKALNAAALFEIDDVIDPAETRHIAAQALRPPPFAERRRTFLVDTW